MTGSDQVSPGVRSVLAAPRGHRFPRTGTPLPSTQPRQGIRPSPESHQARRERLLRQMEGNPRVAYMLEHGEMPHWMKVAQQRREQAEREARQADAEETELPKEPVLRPPRGRHRAPRRWWGWPAAAISSTLLLGLESVQTIGQAVTQNGGFLI